MEAVRARVKRGTIAHEREGGRVYILLDTAQDAAQGTPETDRTAELIATLQEQLAAEREANRENRRIIAALTSRMPAIEAPPDAPGSPETARRDAERDQPRPDAPGPSEAEGAERRPWWKFWL
jgi:hypothetical protein